MTNNNTVKELASQSGITLLGNIIQTLAGFLLVIVATRSLGSELYGIFTLALSITYVLLGLSNLKVYRAIDYFVPQHLADNSYSEAKGTIVSVLLLAVTGSVVGAIVIGLFSSPLAALFNEPRLATLLLVLCLLLPLHSVSKVLFVSFTAIKRMDYRVSIESILLPLFKIGTVILLFFLGLEIYSLVFGYILTTALGVFVSILIIYRRVPWFSQVTAQHPVKRTIISYSAPLALAGIVTTLLGQIDYLLIGYFLESDSVAVYRVAFKLGTGLMIVLTAVTPIFKPMIAEVIGDNQQVVSRYRLATRWITILTVPVFATLVLAPKVYLGLLFTTEFAVGWPVVIILAVGYLINALSGPEGMILEGLGYTRITFLNSVLMLAVNVGLGILLIPRFGIVGAAIATAASVGLSASAGVAEVWYFEGLHPYNFSSIKLILCGGFLYLIFLPLVRLSTSDLLVAISLPVLTPIFYLILIRLAGGFVSEDEYLAGVLDKKLGSNIFSWIISS
ncbi:flippase [Halorubrum ezzemoulense]|uniref:flippase n=1 Tax=Halorubrum ezzemoulense TaxID=337243 RepID=UPI00232F0D1B|nr:flippase [Halorubrum ezzemoulense]MDB9281716.1 flippase [Halorubrum ezzemoulense]MDB9285209.1 flippase [Halorubrum ezzemoulense]